MNPLFLSLLALAANAQDYFPLQVGNQWTYRTTGPGAQGNLTLQVTREVEADGAVYHELAGFAGGPYWLRKTEAGALVVYDRASRQERTWYAFQAAEGSTYATSLPWCCGRARLVSRAAKYSGPLGHSSTALEFIYPGVIDVGVSWEQFLPGLGLAHRIEYTGGSTFVRHDLVYASLRDSSGTAPEVDFTFSLQSNSVAPGAPIQARLTLHNRQTEPVTLTFPTGQRYDFVIRDGEGNECYRWSDGMMFTDALIEERVEDEKHWPVTLNPPSLPVGSYTLEAVSPALSWRAVAALSVQSE